MLPCSNEIYLGFLAIGWTERTSCICDYSDLPSHPILQLGVMRTPNHINSSNKEIILYGIVCLFSILVEM